ncbi:hypothetical protein GKZ68_20935 (plasmid) [Hymenobacter sp. BRD128]|uniref:hypothetical protein n=1 Tax=Hymenobacter sp. BRD128 TaxID=2675878 RepID=UPI0015678691|nr:hypothetical protein [Hymenobacter sp. BRD128]QKG59148.1 hypothetical protein GKZ68_20935 [Hymenobacter sp. BRD128]
MQIITLGKPYPFPNPAPGQNGTRMHLTERFLTVVCSLNQPTSQEIALWRGGQLRYGIYEPGPGLLFLVSELGPGWLFEATLNLRQPGPEAAVAAALAWPQQSGDRLEYVLLDATTNVVHGWRSFAAAPAFNQAVRAAAARQLQAYPTAAQATAGLKQAEQTYSLRQLSQCTHFYSQL